jgi:hypothetical protein
MSTKNGEIATNNNSKEGFSLFGAKGVMRETLKAPKMILKDTKGTKYIEDVEGTMVEIVLY